MYGSTFAVEEARDVQPNEGTRLARDLDGEFQGWKEQLLWKEGRRSLWSLNLGSLGNCDFIFNHGLLLNCCLVSSERYFITTSRVGLQL